VKAFFDASVLVGVFSGDHPSHAACLRLLEDASKKTHFCVARADPELYAVTARLPVRPGSLRNKGCSLGRTSGTTSRSSPSAGTNSSKRRRESHDRLTLKCALSIQDLGM
jgi:hypothetical protein